jgi:hypothetical protein
MAELWTWRGRVLPLHRHCGDAFVEITSVTATQRSRLQRGYAIESSGAPVIYPEKEKEAVRKIVVAAGEYAHDLQPLTKVLPVTRLVRNTVDAVYQG